MSFFESRLRVDFENIEEVKKSLNFCEELGIKNLILEPKKATPQIFSELKKEIENETVIQIFFRRNLKLGKVNEFKKALKQLNKFPYILSIETSNKEIQLQAARDSRIDLISFSDPTILRTLSEGVISLAKQNNSFLEFSLAPIMIDNKAQQSKNFRNLYRSIQMMRKARMNYVISGNFENLYDLRNPRNLMSICYSLLGLPLFEAKKAFFEIPKMLIERSYNRQNKDIIESGVKLIKGGD